MHGKTNLGFGNTGWKSVQNQRECITEVLNATN